MRRIYGNAVWVWVLFFVVAVINGVARETLYVPGMGPVWGRLAGTVVLIVVMLVITWVFLRRHAATLNRTHLVVVGMLWVALSALFELGVSHYVMEMSWDTLLTHYNVMQGRFRIFVRLTELIGPSLVGARVLARRRPAEPPPEPAEAAPEPEPEAEPAGEAEETT